MATHGTFYWNELVSRDAAAATAFYTDLLGWTAEQMDDAPMPYTLLKAKGVENPVAGLMQMPEEWGDTPSHWGSYIAVDDVDVVLARVESLGGSVAVPAFDVPEVGRMAFIQDPSGARVAIMTAAEVAEPA